MRHEQRNVHSALSQLGFVGVTPFDYIFHRDGVTCAIPVEETMSFDAAVKFLREGAFQPTLQRPTRLLYYRLAQQLDRCRMKGIDERRIRKEQLSPTA